MSSYKAVAVGSNKAKRGQAVNSEDELCSRSFHLENGQETSQKLSHVHRRRTSRQTFVPSEPFDPANPDDVEYYQVGKPTKRCGTGTCQHDGICSADNARCECAMNATTCRTGCRCGASCLRQFPPCACVDSCGRDCVCVLFAQQCQTSCSSCKGSCNIHQSPKLFVGLSQIDGAGKGVFAMQRIEAGTWLGEYTGPIVPKTKSLDPAREFAISLDYSIDGAQGDSLLSYMNHSNDASLRNAHFFYREGPDCPRVFGRAMRTIKPLEELYVDYGTIPLWKFETAAPLKMRGSSADSELRMGDFVFVRSDVDKQSYWIAKLRESVSDSREDIQIYWLYRHEDLPKSQQRFRSGNPWELRLSDHTDLIPKDSIAGRAGVWEFGEPDQEDYFWMKLYRPRSRWIRAS